MVSTSNRIFVSGLVLLLLVPLTVNIQTMAQVPPKLAGAGWRTDWDSRTVDLAELEVNIPRDGIPSIEDPRFVTTESAAAWISEVEPVVSIQIGEVSRAYPLQILTWHEIVNDRIHDIPVAVTFCPLCYSALVFDRRIGEEELQFGVSGMLRRSDMVMFDRQTHSLWQQVSGESIVGKLSGTVLRQIPAQIISFSEFRDAHPDGKVLSRETGFDRRYGQNPYQGYDDIDARPWLFRGPLDNRLPPMEKVVTVTVGESHKAYPHSITRERRVVQDRIQGTPIVVFHSENGAASALDRTEIGKSRILGSTGVFNPVLEDGRELTFDYDGGLFVDNQTHSTWNVTGKSVTGTLAGTQLEPISHSDMFSFAWFAFRPDTQVYRE